MFYYLAQLILRASAHTAWAKPLGALRLFRYITFRSAGAAVTALVLSWCLAPTVITWLRRLRFGQEYNDIAASSGGMAERGAKKKGTPTMGGILIVLALNLTTLLWARLNPLVLLALFSVIVLCGLGFYDDYTKIIQQTGGGGAPSVKLWIQCALALFIALY